MIPARHRGEGIAGRTERLAERRLDRIGSRSRSKRGAPLVPDDADDGVAGVMLAVRLRRVSRTARDHNAGSLARTVAADNGVVIVQRIRLLNHVNQRKLLSVGVSSDEYGHQGISDPSRGMSPDRPFSRGRDAPPIGGSVPSASPPTPHGCMSNLLATLRTANFALVCGIPRGRDSAPI